MRDASLDLVTVAFGFRNLANYEAGLAEMHRVLRPGGRAVAAVWGARNRCGWAEIFSIVDRRVASEVCPMFFQLGTGNTTNQVAPTDVAGL